MLRHLLFLPILIEFICICILFQLLTFLFTGRTELNIMVGNTNKTFVISRGEQYEEDKKMFSKKTPPYGQAAKELGDTKRYDHLRKAGAKVRHECTSCGSSGTGSSKGESKAR